MTLLLTVMAWQADSGGPLPVSPRRDLWWPEAANGVCPNGVHASYQRGVGLLDSASVMIRWETSLPYTYILDNTYGATVWDVDLDGVPEVLVAYGKINGISQLLVMDGPTGIIEWTWTTPGLYIGDLTPPVADLDLDGHPEIIIVNQRAEGIDSLMVYAIDGVTREVKWKQNLWSDTYLTATQPTIGDVDGDGRPEVVICGGRVGEENIFCLNGEDGSIRWVKYGFRSLLPAIGDVNGDGINEVICEPLPLMQSPWLAALSGLDGSVVWLNADSTLAGLFSVPTITDADGDGKQEVIAKGDYKPPNQYPVPAICWFDGETGALERVYTLQRNCWVSKLCATANLDEDPAQETVVWFFGNRKHVCLDGATAGVEWVYPPAESTAGSNSALADIDNDGEIEVITLIAKGVPVEEIYLICLSSQGELKWKMDFSNPNQRAGNSPVIADVDNDGYLEIILAPSYGSGDLRVRCIDNERALPAKEEKALRPPSMVAMPGRIILSLPDPCPIDLSVYDLAGRKVKELYKGQLPAGTHEFELSGLEPGVYVARLSYDGVITTKAVVIKR